jgi:hypothetical protein
VDHLLIVNCPNSAEILHIFRQFYSPPEYVARFPPPVYYPPEYSGYDRPPPFAGTLSYTLCRWYCRFLLGSEQAGNVFQSNEQSKLKEHMYTKNHS